MPNHIIKRFTTDPTCAVCHRIVSRLRTKCDNCGRAVCRSHRPLFTPYWQCPDCIARIQSFAPQQQGQPTQPVYPNEQPLSQAASTNDFLHQLKTAESLCGIEDSLADQIIETSLLDLFLDDK